MTEPCSKEAEIATIQERTKHMEKYLEEIHNAVIGNGKVGIKGKIIAHTVQLSIQWVMIFAMLSYLVYNKFK